MAAADQLAEKLDRLEQRTDEKAKRIRKTFHRQSEAIDPDLTEIARKQRIGELHEQAERKLRAAREEHEADSPASSRAPAGKRSGLLPATAPSS